MTTMLWRPAASDRFTPGREVPIDRIVIHTTTTTFDGAVAIFQGGSRMVSAHYIVDKTQDRIARCVLDEDTAWGCGNWPMNQRCLNVENVDDGDYNGLRPAAQYARSAALVRQLCISYSIPIDRSHILAHWEVTSTACPDSLDYDRIVREAATGGTMALTADDKKYIDQRIRDLLLGEPQLTMTALKRGMNSLTQYQATAPKKATKKSDVTKWHGRG